jgi:tight adherence protein C
MSLTLAFSLTAIFVAVAALSGLALSRTLAWAAPERKRLRDLGPAATGVVREDLGLTETPIPALRQLSKALPKSPKEMGRLRRQLTAAGHYELSTAVYYSAAKLAAPVACAGAPLLLMGVSAGWTLALIGAVLGYLLPEYVLARMIRAHAKAIQNGLPDVLDLLIVCVEAGSSLDQSIVKASDELEVAHPALAKELRIVTTEIRAGKPRLEAFRNFADRTKVDDVRSLVTMLTQTDRFGTSVAQALRIHAETSRTKRRQRAEERAAKIGAKMVIPLALCIFPAVFAVCLGPLVVIIYRGLLV